MKNLTVAFKLGMGFGLVIFLLTVIVLTAIFNMSGMNATTTQITQQFYANVALANEADKNARDNAKFIRQLFIADGEEELDQVKQKIKANRDENMVILGKLDQQLKSEKGRAQLGEVQQSRDALAPKYDQLYALLKTDRNAALAYMKA
ncbi:conserved hypothetical protein, partial [Ricinus communis]